MDLPNNTQSVPMQPPVMNTTMNVKEEKGGFPWLVIIILLLVLGAIAWFFFVREKQPTIIDEVEPQVVVENVPQVEVSDIQYDQRGLPILGPNAPISNVRVIVSESFPIQVGLAVTGELPNGCTYLNSPVQVRENSTFYVSLTTATEGDVCTEALVPYERNIMLDVAGLPAGSYMVNINGMEYRFDIAQENSLNFEAGFDK